jgi:hypothetical protein
MFMTSMATREDHLVGFTIPRENPGRNYFENVKISTLTRAAEN